MSTAAGYYSDAWRRLLRNRVAVASGLLILAAVVFVIVGPLLAPNEFDVIHWEAIAVPPQLEGGHLFGTDRLGRDLLARSMYAVGISLFVGLAATAVTVLIGIAWGATAGYVGGWADQFMMRVVDVLYALPYFFIVIVLTTLMPGDSIRVLLLAIAAVGWLTTARIVRGQALALRRREFVEAAIATGVPVPRILFRHVVPNVMGTVVVYATLTIPNMILLESFLSFLGLGVQEPLASLGTLINEGAQEMESAPWMLLVPAGLLVALLVAFNFLGDGLRDALDPRQH
jgi:oligopeptide transport system permease protein